MKMKFVLKLAVLALAGTAYSQVLNASTLTSVAENGNTSFVAIGKPAMLRIKGAAKGPEGKLNLDQRKVSGVLSLDMSKLHTGLDLRDEHMQKKYLEVGKFPKSELKLDSLSVPALAPGASIKDIPFEGTLSLHGETKTVKGTAQVNVKGEEYEIIATFSLNLSDFKIDIPSYMGIKVADTVNVEVSAVFSETK